MKKFMYIVLCFALVMSMSVTAFAAMDDKAYFGDGEIRITSEGAIVTTGNETITGTLGISGDVTASGNITGDGDTEIVGCISDVVEKSATYTTTIAEAGTLFTNYGAAAEITFVLPEASTVVGASYAFGLVGTYTTNVDVDDADQILGATNAAGDKVQGLTAGDVIVLTAADYTNWIVQSVYPASTDWADAN